MLLCVLLAVAQPPVFPELPGRAGRANAFADVADVSTEIVPAKAKPGEPVVFRLTVSPKPGCYTYPTQVPPGQFSRNEFTPPTTGPIRFSGPPTDPPGAKTKPGLNPGDVEAVYPTAATWEFKGTVAADAKPGRQTVALTGVQVQACNESNCFMSEARNPPSAAFEVLPGPPSTVVAVSAPDAPDPPAGAPPPTADHAAKLQAVRERIEAQPVESAGSFGGLIAAAVFWGLVSLATPCVFPMIPITVGLFLKQGQRSTGGAVKLAAVYSLTIVAILGLSAYFLLRTFTALSTSPEMNAFLGVLFLVFAFSFLGAFDLTLPGFLVRGAEGRRKQGGLVGTVFGAVAFSLVSFTCVAPFLGGFAGLTASGQYGTPALVAAAVAFAAAFASPFFLLALFPSLVRTLPRSGSWLDSVKAVMGFVELAAALKFFRTAELRLLDRPAYFTYDLVLAGWVAVSLACGLYLLHLFRLSHDEDGRPAVGVVRLLVALGFLGFAAYLSPALFDRRPAGVVYAWVDAFLLPEPAEAKAGELPWGTDLTAAVNRIQQQKRATGTAAKPLIFLDFTGVTCTNCRYNEKTVFTQPQVKELLKRYELVALYTDEVPADYYPAPVPRSSRRADAQANADFQDGVFRTTQLPLYAILEPQTSGAVRVVGVYAEGKINNPAAFAEFLAGPLTK